MTPPFSLIVITRPDFFPHESEEITALFEAGLSKLHLRKPQSTCEELTQLLLNIPERYRSRIVLHDHLELCSVFQLAGVHLNQRNPLLPTHHTGTVSRSCHSLEEVEQYKKECDYVFLSPIYDSISKEGYGAAFSHTRLLEAKAAGLIDEKVYALGGITLSHLPELHSLNFGGAALLGDIWQKNMKERVEYLSLGLKSLK